MTGFSPAMDWRPLVVSGVVQGLGLGLVFVPLSTLAFATLEPRFRADAASLFSLVRNIGSSVGISIVATQLAHNTVAARSDLVSKLTPFSQNLDALFGSSTDVTSTLVQLNAEVQAQAAMVAYVDDFMLMFYLTLAAIPLIFLLRKAGAPAAGGHAAAME
jgi:DHA2 family multidrug resistance protein